jgi:SAM-dependent methyltransferase
VALLRQLIRLVPSTIKTELKRRVRVLATPSGSEIVSRLYIPEITETSGGTEIPWKITPAGRRIAWNRPAVTQTFPESRFPIPPPHLTQGYAHDEREFLDMGRRTSETIRRIAAQQGIALGSGRTLEWGCASGRVLRHFADEAHHADFWGIDVDGPHINWAKRNLSPPFRFVTCTSYPHLPFEDNSFDFVFGISIFSHIVHLIDMWLMEFRRILAPGGRALFTVHDENTWEYFGKNGRETNPWVPNEQFSGGLKDDVVVLCDANAPFWGSTFTFFRTEWITEEWGKFLDVVAIEPFAEWYQTAVVLRKPGRFNALGQPPPTDR